jgi:beta-galactosidase
MKRTFVTQCFSVALAAAVVLSSGSLPVSAAPADTAQKAAAETEAEREVNFNKDWKFIQDDPENAQEISFDDSQWESISIPHDYSITQEYSNSNEAESGFLPGGTGWYRKTFTLPADYAGKTLVLNFDGVYNHAYVYINGQKLGENHYGYNDFSFDLSDYVTCDGSTENVLAVKVVHNTPSSRWYSGSGIYRDVKLVVTDPVHVAKNGTYVTTPNLEQEKNGNVTVHVETTVDNDNGASVGATVRTTVLDSTGTAVSTPVESAVTVSADSSAEVTQETTVSKPKLWSCEDPNLYTVETNILVNGVVTDTYETTFGFRYIAYDANTGFSLNGQNVKIKGVCMHHDQGALGAAAYKDAIYRQVEKLKEMGCNAIRTSHSTPADVLIQACNELGMMVMDETFDGWAYPKNGNSQDFSTHFAKYMTADNQILGGDTSKTWYQFVLESNVERDKNAPCVIMWDIGNELNFGVSDSSQYVTYAQDMVSIIQSIDETRPITSGDNNSSGNASANPTDFRNKITAVLAQSGGVAGLNYSMYAASSVHSAHPTWPIIFTESASPSNSRGIYSTTDKYSKTGDYQCTAYDTNWVSWGNSARESWWYTIKDDFVSGEFIWTGFDYIGEPTPWNGTATGSISGDADAVPNSSYFGVIDTAGFEKDSFYYYTSQWRDDATTLHVVPQSWNEEDLAVSNGKVPVYIYSNAAKVELYLNDTLIGTATRNVTTTAAGHTYATYTNVSNEEKKCTAVNEDSTWKQMAAQFSVTYEEGTLSTKAYDENGVEITDTLGLSSVTTNSDKGTSLKVTAEETEIAADGSSLCYIAVEVTDAEGNFVSAADNNIQFTLTGNGIIVGVDNGNPSTTDKFQQASVLTSSRTANIDAFSGKALVIVRSTEKAGGFILNAKSSGLTGNSVFVNTTGEEEGQPFLKDYQVTTDYTVVMGTAPQLQNTVTGTLTDGTAITGTITWDEVTKEIYEYPGEYTINGTLKAGDEEISLTASLHVKPIITGVENYSRATTAGYVPKLPDTVSGILPDGTTYGAYPVTWDSLTANDLKTVGTIVTVNGKATVEDGVVLPVTATIRVAEGVTVEAANVAPMYATLTESCGETADNLLSITDGVNNVLTSAQARWTNWNDHLTNSSPSITFTWDETKELASLNAWFYGDSSVTAPEAVTIEVSEDGVSYKEVKFAAIDYTVNQKNEFIFNEPQKAKALRLTMKQVGTGYVGLTEVEIWTSDSGYSSYDTAVLDSLTIDGATPSGFTAGTWDEAGYTLKVEDAKKAVVEATAQDNASVTILPVDSDKVLHILVTSEDHSVTKLYTIQLTDDQKDTPSTDESETRPTETPAPPSNGSETETGSSQLPAVGTTRTVKKGVYKILTTGQNASDRTVAYVKPDKTTYKKVAVPATVKIDGLIYRVTSISNKAFKNNKKLTKVTIGKNVKTIGKAAFAKDAKLKSILVKSTVLTKVGKGALKGVSGSCKIKVSAKKWKAYKKLFKGKGQKKTVKVVK